MEIQLKRAYDTPSKGDGFRALVDHLWPRGLLKDNAKIDAWVKDVSPSDELRMWFHHDPQKWQEFKYRYFQELDKHRTELAQLVEKARKGTLTLVFSAKNTRFNNAAALKEYIEKKYLH